MGLPELGRDSIQLVPPAANQNQVKTIRSQEPGQLEADSARRAGHQCPQRRALGAIVSRHVSCPRDHYERGSPYVRTATPVLVVVLLVSLSVTFLPPSPKKRFPVPSATGKSMTQ